MDDTSYKGASLSAKELLSWRPIRHSADMELEGELDNVVEDEGIKLHWRVSYYDVNKNICNVNENKNIAFRILEILFDC